MAQQAEKTRGAAAHTSGPWKIGCRDKIIGELFIEPCRDAAPVGAVFLYDTGRSAEENKANARLIAEAPALLVALEAVLARTKMAKDHAEASDILHHEIPGIIVPALRRARKGR